MCELLGISSAHRVRANELLKEFYSHSLYHPNGWGLAVFHGDVASIEKEPVRAVDSGYLRQRLRHTIEAKTLIAHIRLATVGSMDYENCHPFIRQDTGGRRWTLAHNGTIFHGDLLDPYFYQQEGRTDSERILYYLVDQVNLHQRELGRALTAEERFTLLDGVICTLAPGNKLNLLLYDGEIMYVHTNYAHSLYVSQTEETTVLATKPVGKGVWNELPMNTLLSFRHGKQLRSGTDHGFAYIDNAQDLKFLHLDSAEL